jgi:hypothetical protein
MSGDLIWEDPLSRRKPLSRRRQVEFRGRYLRRMFGDAEARAARKELLMRLYGVDDNFLARVARRTTP